LGFQPGTNMACNRRRLCHPPPPPPPSVAIICIPYNKRDFYLVFFLAQTRVCGLARCIEKIPFPLRRAHRLPFPSFNPNNTPPPARAPLPPMSYEGACRRLCRPPPPPPPLVAIICIYRTIRTPSEKLDCTNSFV
jgi:hypothetical protein